MTMTPEQIAIEIARAFYDKQADDIRILDVSGISTVTDYCVIASGLSAPHLRAIALNAEKHLKALGVTCYRKSGDPESGWILVDYVHAVGHIFAPDAREYYSIERLWQGAKEVPFTPEA